MTDQLNFPDPALTPNASEAVWLAWKETPEGRIVLDRFFRIAWAFVPEWRRTQKQVESKLPWALCRHWFKHHAIEGLPPRHEFRMRNALLPYVARHFMAHKGCEGMFETAAVGKRKKVTKEITVRMFG